MCKVRGQHRYSAEFLKRNQLIIQEKNLLKFLVGLPAPSLMISYGILLVVVVVVVCLLQAFESKGQLGLTRAPVQMISGKQAAIIPNIFIGAACIICTYRIQTGSQHESEACHRLLQQRELAYAQELEATRLQLQEEKKTRLQLEQTRRCR